MLVDKTARLELLAEVYLKNNQQEKATDCYRQLLKRNPSNMQYYKQIFIASGVDLSNIDEAAEDTITKILNEKIEENPKLLFLKRIKLNYLVREETFKALFEEYCKFILEKGIPSLVNDIECMITENKMKFRVVKETFERYLESIQRDLSIDGEERDPLYECFLLFFLSQINFIDGDYFKAHELIEEAINHTPTFIEAWQFKARIMDAFGDRAAAEEAFLTAKNLDTADRFLNAECAKYFIRNNKQEEANIIMKRWSVDMASDELNSFDFQNMWYEIESGYGHYNNDRPLDAFRMFYYIERHIITMLQDFYDFHFYTMRKFMLRTYMNIGSMQDSLRRNPYVQEGMVGMLRILNKFYSRLNNGSEEEKEKFHKWINEEAAKNEEEEEAKITKWEEVEERNDPIEKLADPNAAKALKRIIDAGIVKEAVQRCTENLKFVADNKRLHYHAIKWFLRGNQYNQAVKSLKYLHENHPSWIKTAYISVIFRQHFERDEIKSKLNDKQAMFINMVIMQLFGEKDAKSYFEGEARDRELENLMNQRYYIKGLVKLFKESVTKEQLQNIFSILDKAIKDKEFKKQVLKHIRQMVKVLNYLSDELRDQLIELADQVFWKFKENQLEALNV